MDKDLKERLALVVSYIGFIHLVTPILHAISSGFAGVRGGGLPGKIAEFMAGIIFEPLRLLFNALSEVMFFYVNSTRSILNVYGSGWVDEVDFGSTIFIGLVIFLLCYGIRYALTGNTHWIPWKNKEDHWIPWK